MVSRTSDWRDELGRWLKPFLDRLGHKARRQMCPLYVSGLILLWGKSPWVGASVCSGRACLVSQRGMKLMRSRPEQDFRAVVYVSLGQKSNAFRELETIAESIDKSQPSPSPNTNTPPLPCAR